MDGAATLADAIELREAIYRIYLAIASGARPSDGDLASLNRAVSEALRHACVRPIVDCYAWDWSDTD